MASSRWSSVNIGSTWEQNWRWLPDTQFMCGCLVLHIKLLVISERWEFVAKLWLAAALGSIICVPKTVLKFVGMYKSCWELRLILYCMRLIFAPWEFCNSAVLLSYYCYFWWYSHLNGPVYMVRNKIVALSFYCCLGLVLCLSETGLILFDAELEFSDYRRGYSKARFVLSFGH